MLETYETHPHAQMNMRGVFLHVLADALGSVVVIISALIMWQTEWEYKIYVDPALSLLLVCIMMKVGRKLICLRHATLMKRWWWFTIALLIC